MSEAERQKAQPQHLPFLTLLLLLLISLYVFHGSVRAWFSGRYRAVREFSRALDLCLDEFREPRPPEELLHGAIEGMVNSLDDPHSAFLDPQDNKRLVEVETGRYAGLGILIRLTKDKKLRIEKVFDGSPAQKAGLKPGDIILSAAEHDPSGLREPLVTDLTTIKSLSKTSTVLKGRPGTRVTLGILRDGKRLEITVTRAIIEAPVVEHRPVDWDIGYLRISDFPDNTASRVRAAIEELKKQGARALVIDLRGNAGGFLDQAVATADLFIRSGVIVSTRNRNQRENRVFHANPGGPAEDIPLAVLVDGGSASAAEVLAGTLQDHGRAKLVGQKTYGKGAVSKRFPLPDGSGILLSTGIYILPKGRQIEGKGLAPDLEVKPPKPEELEALKPGETPPDPQLDAAVELLKKQLSQTRKSGSPERTNG